MALQQSAHKRFALLVIVLTSLGVVLVSRRSGTGTYVYDACMKGVATEEVPGDVSRYDAYAALETIYADMLASVEHESADSAWDAFQVAMLMEAPDKGWVMSAEGRDIRHRCLEPVAALMVRLDAVLELPIIAAPRPTEWLDDAHEPPFLYMMRDLFRATAMQAVFEVYEQSPTKMAALKRVIRFAQCVSTVRPIDTNRLLTMCFVVGWGGQVISAAAPALGSADMRTLVKLFEPPQLRMSAVSDALRVEYGLFKNAIERLANVEAELRVFDVVDAVNALGSFYCAAIEDGEVDGVVSADLPKWVIEWEGASGRERTTALFVLEHAANASRLYMEAGKAIVKWELTYLSCVAECERQACMRVDTFAALEAVCDRRVVNPFGGKGFSYDNRTGMVVATLPNNEVIQVGMPGTLGR